MQECYYLDSECMLKLDLIEYLWCSAADLDSDDDNTAVI